MPTKGHIQGICIRLFNERVLDHVDTKDSTVMGSSFTQWEDDFYAGYITVDEPNDVADMEAYGIHIRDDATPLGKNLNPDIQDNINTNNQLDTVMWVGGAAIVAAAALRFLM